MRGINTGEGESQILIVEMDPIIVSASVEEEKIHVNLRDGREVSASLRWFPRLAKAAPEQRRRVEIDPDGTAVHWPELDEDIDVSSFLAREAIVVFPPEPMLVADDGSLSPSRETTA